MKFLDLTEGNKLAVVVVELHVGPMRSGNETLPARVCLWAVCQKPKNKSCSLLKTVPKYYK